MFGNCGRQRTGKAVPRRPSISRCVNKWRTPRNRRPARGFVLKSPRVARACILFLGDHIDDSFGCGEPDLFPKARAFSAKRFEPSVHVGMELA